MNKVKSMVLLMVIVGCVVGSNPKGDPHASFRRQLGHDSLLKTPKLGESKHYETDNGIAIQAAGELKPIGNDLDQVIKVENSFKTTESVPVVIMYVADEGGSRTPRDAIPTPPPIPPA